MAEEERVGGGDGGDELRNEFGAVLVAELKGGFEFLG